MRVLNKKSKQGGHESQISESSSSESVTLIELEKIPVLPDSFFPIITAPLNSILELYIDEPLQSAALS